MEEKSSTLKEQASVAGGVFAVAVAMGLLYKLVTERAQHEHDKRAAAARLGHERRNAYYM
jgi:hypothetical protein